MIPAFSFYEKTDETDLNLTEMSLWVSNWFANSVILLNEKKYEVSYLAISLKNWIQTDDRLKISVG